MQKKVLFGSLSEEELLDRISKGESFYEDNNQKVHYKVRNNILCEYDKDGKLVYLNAGLVVLDNFYFLNEADEVEEPEADGSCIGKLCWVWDKGDEKKTLGFLEEIKIMESEDDKYPVYIDGFGQHWEHCQALTKEEALALVKE